MLSASDRTNSFSPVPRGKPFRMEGDINFGLELRNLYIRQDVYDPLIGRLDQTGRSPALQAGGRAFKSRTVHFSKILMH